MKTSYKDLIQMNLDSNIYFYSRRDGFNFLESEEFECYCLDSSDLEVISAIRNVTNDFNQDFLLFKL